MSLEEFWDLLLRDLDLSLQPFKKAKTLSFLTVDQLVGSMKTYEMSLPTSKKSKEIVLIPKGLFELKKRVWFI